MNDGDEISFIEMYGYYFRFPLDRGPVTIQIMERDRGGGGRDDCLGSLTITGADYNALIDEGAQVMVASQ